jgi:hypothetical protein
VRVADGILEERAAAAPDAIATRLPRAWTTALAAVAFVVVAAALSHRALSLLNVPGRPDAEHWALQDFRDAIYYPVVAFLDGRNPYEHTTYRQAYPVGQTFAPYAPAVLLVYLPFGLLPFESAELVYFVLTLGLTVLLAHVCLRLCGLAGTAAATLAVAALVLTSRPGHQNLLLGQCTVQVVLGAYAAMALATRRPWLGGLGLALCLLKPHFGVPLALLMLCRGEGRAVAVGAGLVALASAPPLVVLVARAGGVGAFAASILANLGALDDNPTGNALSGWARVDAGYLLSHALGRAPGAGVELGVTLAVLAVAGLALRRVARDGVRDRWWSATLASLAVLLCIYHQAYDVLLLAFPLTALVAAPAATPFAGRPGLRWLLVGLLALPAVNYLATWSVIGRLGISGGTWLLVTSLNAAALAAAFALLLLVPLKEDR